MPSFLRPLSRLVPHEHLHRPHHSTTTMAPETLEVLAAAGVLDPKDLLSVIAPPTHAPLRPPSCPLMDLLSRPKADDVVWPGKLSKERLQQAKEGEKLEQGPRSDERILLWAVEGQALNPMLRVGLIQWATERQMPWGLAGLLIDWGPEEASEVIKGLREALSQAVKNDTPQLIEALLTHASQHSWPVNAVNLLKEAKGFGASKAIVSTVDRLTTGKNRGQAWEDCSREWYWAIPTAQAGDQNRSSPSYGLLQPLRKQGTPQIVDWAFEHLCSEPEYPTALGRTMAARLLSADNGAFEKAADDYARHWKSQGWAPDEHVPRTLAGTFLTMPLLKNTPGRRIHRLQILFDKLNEHLVGTESERRHTQVQLKWLEEVLLLRAKDDYHQLRYQEQLQQLAPTDAERTEALKAFAAPDCKRTTIGTNTILDPVGVKTLVNQALTWVFGTNPPEDSAEVLRTCFAILKLNDTQLAIGPSENQVPVEEWNRWMQRVSVQAQEGNPWTRHLLSPLLELASLTPAPRIKREEREQVWVQAAESHEEVSDLRTTLVRTVRTLVQAGASYDVPLEEGHRFFELHDFLREAALQAGLPAPRPAGPRLRF